MTRHLITGGSGFVGSNLIRKLVNQGQHELFILTRNDSDLWRINDLKSQINIIETDLSNYEKVENVISNTNPDFVYHLGAYGGYPFQTDKQKIFQVNIINSINLFQSLTKCDNIKLIINFGSSSEYGIKSNPMHENDETNPITPYGISKLTQTKLAQFFHKNEKLPITTVRLFSIFGPLEEPGRLIYDIMVSIIKEKPIELSSPFPRRDYVFVDDLIEAVEVITKSKNVVGEIFNIGSGNMYSVEEVVNMALEITKSRNKILWNMKQKRTFDDATPWSSNTEKIKKELKWEPRHTFADGLHDTYEWYLNNQKIWDRE